MNDDQMDEILIEGANDYNAPGAIPREEMWSRIRTERSKRAGVPVAVVAAKRPRWQWMTVAAAAAILLAVGVVIGRRLERTLPQGAPTVAVQPVVVTPKQDSAPAAGVKNDTIIPQLQEETRKTGRRVQELAANVPGAENRTGSDPNLAYRLVMLRHIAGSEAMITAFRASARRGEADAALARWARELLSTTRMLEASPVTEDPIMKRLLEDLDLVIVQIAQYTTKGTVDTEELDLIEQSITKRGVITKLRSTLPVRATPTGT